MDALKLALLFVLTACPRRGWRRVVGPSLLLLGAAACTATTIDRPALPTTDGVPSSDLTITLNFARSNGVVAQAQLELFVKGARTVLAPADALVLHDASGNSRAFEEDQLEAGGEYEAEIATEDTALAIDFTRNGAVQKTIPITLPPAFDLAPPDAASRASPITVTWTAAGPFPMDVTATGAPCLPPEGFTSHFEPDTGVFVIQPADLVTVSGACDITVVATRGNQSTQVRTILVPTTP